ncbi:MULTISPECIES: PE family protein [Mycobacterium]|uniref:PE domain-containing protein n=1 Tax=Mycobacterium kiyosense TaxID=2871094 RepID=A0A9P3UZU2_9MYCO|nr:MULTISPECIES: PE family protein [Mycobacterium]BDB42293.1 hypothetical protein IWGMT90018_27390 [Mycobacterium kiyosense]BDE14434.1 hypothetical protein MKCMC460_32940 [Mycobacterium sp. 20KCMC460]GLB84924.1 hypothetical protein SRL2020028_41800 [Mycobacterium kiyosense]GLB98077.1 hypothetical protein SRL2020226_48530 [Mycobacterium kiyosense]GLC16269.1 hypothetical protein SRL2020448_48720 [Mycobacterium kiyosense]
MSSATHGPPDPAPASTGSLGVVPAGADVVSALVATQFCLQAARFQQVSARARAIQDRLVSLLGAAAGPA